ncbi:hypothetical protein GCM10020001_043830 [Nonomuraea salmonea]
MKTEKAVIAEGTGRRAHGFRATISSVIGFALDLYDLYVIVFVAPAIAAVFFPLENSALALAGSYVALAATLIMRPVGAALMGVIGDRHGRKRAMVVALLGVGGVTAAMGLLPGAQAIGLAAPLLLLVLRLAQGLFVGGVFASTLTLATESVPARWRGLVSGVVGGGGTAIGSLLAALALFTTTRIFPGEAFDEWGWRVMFLAGGLPVLVSVLVVKYVDESPLWRAKEDGAENPLTPLLSRGPHRKVLAANIAVVFGVATFFLLTLGLLPSFLQVVNGLSVATVSVVLVWVNLAAFAFAPLSGHLSERYGRAPRAALRLGAQHGGAALPVPVAGRRGLAPPGGAARAAAVGADHRRVRAAAHLPERALPHRDPRLGDGPVDQRRVRPGGAGASGGQRSQRRPRAAARLRGGRPGAGRRGERGHTLPHLGTETRAHLTERTIMTTLSGTRPSGGSRSLRGFPPTRSWPPARC